MGQVQTENPLAHGDRVEVFFPEKGWKHALYRRSAVFAGSHVVVLMERCSKHHKAHSLFVVDDGDMRRGWL